MMLRRARTLEPSFILLRPYPAEVAVSVPPATKTTMSGQRHAPEHIHVSVQNHCLPPKPEAVALLVQRNS